MFWKLKGEVHKMDPLKQVFTSCKMIQMCLKECLKVVDIGGKVFSFKCTTLEGIPTIKAKLMHYFIILVSHLSYDGLFQM
jgi:hypothetical protein